MSDEMFIKKYEELLDKGYCNCNEMNCLDNDTPRRILNIVKGTKLEAKQLLTENINLTYALDDFKQKCDKALELLQLIHYKFPEYDSIHNDIEDIQKVLRGGINEC